jgi:hypothetical protein
MTQGKEFTIGGKRVMITSSQVVAALRGTEPGPIQTHAVEISGLLYPVKEAFARVTGLDLLDFNTNQARSIFRRLGFKVVRWSEPKETPGILNGGGGDNARV